MVRQRIDKQVQKRMWEAVFSTAMRFYGREGDDDWGIIRRIATDAKVTPQAVSGWKSGSKYPKDESLRRLSAKYKVSVTYLAGFSEKTDVYPPADEQFLKAFDLTELLLSQLLPDATMEEVLSISRKAVGLFQDHNTEAEVHQELFKEIVRIKNNRDATS